MAQEDRARRQKETPIRVTPSSGNVFDDPYLPNPDEWLAKTDGL